MVSNVIITQNALEKVSANSEHVPPALSPEIRTPATTWSPPPGKDPATNWILPVSLNWMIQFSLCQAVTVPKKKMLMCFGFHPLLLLLPLPIKSLFQVLLLTYPFLKKVWLNGPIGNECEREEESRLARLNQREQHDLALTIAPNTSEIQKQEEFSCPLSTIEYSSSWTVKLFSVCIKTTWERENTEGLRLL